jgi:predicted transcriptional regulator
MSVPTDSAKQHLIAILQQQPEDSSYDELLKELAFARMIDRGLRDVEAGRTVSNAEIRREIESWQEQK